MNRIKRLFSLFLALLMLLGAVSCGEEATESKTEENKGSAVAKTDEEQLEEFVRAYRAGEYKDAMLYQYEDLTKYFVLAEYKNLKYPDDMLIADSVTDEAVEDYLTTIVLNEFVPDDQYTDVTEGKLQKWDVVTIDYEGYMDGEKIKDATAEGQELLLGSGAYIHGFESGMIGKDMSEKIRLDLRFSPYYSAKDKAGKDITFYVTVKKVQRPTIPEITSDIINKMYSTTYKSMDEVKAALKKDMDSAQAGRAHSNITTFLQDDIVKRSTVKEYPEKEVGHYMLHFADYYGQFVETGSTLEEFCKEEMGISFEEFKALARDYAEGNVANTLMILSVCRAENITCSDEQLKAMIRGLYENQNGLYGNMESFLADYSDIYGADYFEIEVLEAAAMEKIRETASQAK